MSKAPKLRFKEFSGDWTEKKFKDIVKINQGLQIAISDRYTEDGENRLFYITNEFLKKESGKKYYIENPPSSVICKESDILMTRTGNTGQVVTGVSGAFHNNFFKINYDSSSHNKMFLYYILTSFKIQKSIIRLAGTSTIPDLNHGDFYNIRISYPSIEEQEKIASFFSLIDDKIYLQSEKVEALKDYKKGMMQKIFSRELRFKDDEGRDYPEWEEKKLKDIDVYISDGNYGEAYPTSSDMVDEGVPFLRGNNIDNGYLNFNDMKYITPEKHSELLSGHIKSKDIIITVRGDIGKVGFATDEYDGANMNAQLALIRVMYDNIDARYIHQYMNTIEFYKEVLKRQTGTALKQLPIGKLKDISLKLPMIEEQIKIATILCKLDNKIEKEQEKLNSLKQYKKGLLQQMFV